MSTFRINIDRQVIKLLGAHLYGDTPSVINELIANAHDALAKRVWLTLNTIAPYSIIVEDDGIGMTVEEINEYYLNIGYNRRLEENLQKSLEESGEIREDMGQKGIGKLAVFALSKIVNLISVKNGHAVGCKMDFDVITQNDGNPEEIDLSEYIIDRDKLSSSKSGTKIELTNVIKDLSKAYRFIVSSITRSFVMNDGKMDIFIRKNDETFQKIERGELNFFEEMDSIITINGFNEYAQRVHANEIEPRYKFISSYDQMVSSTSNESRKRKLDSLPVTIQVFDKKKEQQKDCSFSFSGWIGTVQKMDSFKRILAKDGYTDEEIKDKEIIVIDDNRITVYSRGKVGEYNILPKLQTRAQNDAYLIGEIFVDDFENDKFIDMATSNRRGYQEDDTRYETLCHNLKILVLKLISEKQAISNRRKTDEEDAESKEIEEKFVTGQIKSKPIIEAKLTDTDKTMLVDDFKQFSRALSLSKSTKKIFISHKADCKDFGEFLIDVLLELNPSLKSGIIFTSLPDYGVPHGEDIYEYLKKCFRDDLFVIFLFSKSFYDSDMCISEAGAAWATNKDYTNIVIDMGFSSISKPINNAKSGARFCCDSLVDKKQFALDIQYILKNVDKNYDEEEIIEAIDNVLNIKRLPNMPWYQPKRNFQATPCCTICGNNMVLDKDGDALVYKCTCGGKLNGKVL